MGLLRQCTGCEAWISGSTLCARCQRASEPRCHVLAPDGVNFCKGSTMREHAGEWTMLGVVSRSALDFATCDDDRCGEICRHDDLVFSTNGMRCTLRAGHGRSGHRFGRLPYEVPNHRHAPRKPR